MIFQVRKIRDRGALLAINKLPVAMLGIRKAKSRIKYLLEVKNSFLYRKSLLSLEL
jgi:hypothetical protein